MAVYPECKFIVCKNPRGIVQNFIIPIEQYMDFMMKLTFNGFSSIDEAPSPSYYLGSSHPMFDETK